MTCWILRVRKQFLAETHVAFLQHRSGYNESEFTIPLNYVEPIRISSEVSAVKRIAGIECKPGDNMYDTTNPRIERKIIPIFWAIVFATGILAFNHARSVHVTSVRRNKEDDGTVVFVVKVINPTEHQVLATVRLAAGTASSDSASPWGSVGYLKTCEIAANDTSIVEFRYKAAHARFLGNVKSASVSDTVIRE